MSWARHYITRGPGSVAFGDPHHLGTVPWGLGIVHMLSGQPLGTTHHLGPRLGADLGSAADLAQRLPMGFHSHLKVRQRAEPPVRLPLLLRLARLALDSYRLALDVYRVSCSYQL